MSESSGSSGWNQFLGILREARAEVEAAESAPPIACPNDGEPLLSGPNGELYCPYDGWRPGD